MPWAIRGAWWILGRFALALAAVFTGFPIAARRIADHWVDRAVTAGFPTRYIRTLYRTMITAAWIELIVAWVISSYITIWLTAFVWRVVTIFLTALWLALISML